VYDVVGQIVAHFGWEGRIGVTFPGVLKSGVAHTAANVDKSWLGTHLAEGLASRIPGTVQTLNDADAAGWPRCATAPAGTSGGVVLMLTFGTGIGSALFTDGVLVPNTEFGHIQVDGHDGEKKASAAAKDRDELSYPQWAKRVDRYPRRPRGGRVAGPDHRRRRGEQEGAQVGAAAVDPHPRRPGGAAQRRRDRRRGLAAEERIGQ
jgi:polyphosphate glucokinase